MNNKLIATAKELLALQDKTKLRDKSGDQDDFFFASELKPIVVMELQLASEESANELANRFEILDEQPIEGGLQARVTEMSDQAIDHEESRKAFETLMKSIGGDVMLDQHPLYSHLYRINTMNICWQVWKAGRESVLRPTESNFTQGF